MRWKRGVGPGALAWKSTHSTRADGRKFYDDAEVSYPNATDAEVVSLAVPELVVEIEVVACLGKD